MENKIDSYKIFESVARNESISKASEELFISQPAVSQSIKKLEETIGGELFNRTKFGVRLTSEGKAFYEYIKNVPEKVMHITFMTKAEDKVLSVACASIISRYIFLRKIDELSDTIHIPLPKGAGSNVDAIAKEVIDQYGKEKLYEIAKMNFSNINKI